MLVTAALCWMATGPAVLVRDVGIYPELATQVVLATPARPARPWLRVDEAHGLVTLYDGDHPLAVYAHAPGATPLPVASEPRVRLIELLGPRPRVERGAPPAAEDRDGDGIADRLDVLIGAKKLVRNGAAYIANYRKLPYPGGDVPRTEGVCTDTIVRAFRNAGIDLQRELQDDLRRARRAYPMVKRPDPNIDHRRVKTLLPWLMRHTLTVPAGEPLRPGDVVLFDTFPSKPGPDHIGIVSDRPGPSGQPLIVNNWTVGYRDDEMDLLPAVPVTHRFRLRTPVQARP